MIYLQRFYFMKLRVNFFLTICAKKGVEERTCIWLQSSSDKKMGRKKKKRKYILLFLSFFFSENLFSFSCRFSRSIKYNKILKKRNWKRCTKAVYTRSFYKKYILIFNKIRTHIQIYYLANDKQYELLFHW